MQNSHLASTNLTFTSEVSNKSELTTDGKSMCEPQFSLNILVRLNTRGGRRYDPLGFRSTFLMKL